MPNASPCQPSASPPTRAVQPPPALFKPSPKGCSASQRLTNRYVSYHCFHTFSCLSFLFLHHWYMMSAPHSIHSSQPITTKGLGQHFTSPRKPQNKKKTSNALLVPGQASKWRKLLDELNDLLEARTSEPSPSGIAKAASPPLQHEELLEAPTEPEDISFIDDDQPCIATTEHTRTSRHAASTISMYAGWKALILTIINPFLKYTAATLGQPLVMLGSRLHSCTSQCLDQKLTSIFCLFLDRRQ